MNKDSDENLQQPTSICDKTMVVLPCGPEEFKDFISSLLGKPQTIGKGFTGSFDISFKDIENIHLLILQRIQQQNDASLIQFTSRIIFHDDSSVLLNSIDDLLHYNEIRPIVSTAIYLSWSFIVRFQDRSTPEKQDIDVSFISKSGTNGPFIHGGDGSIIFASSDTPDDGFISLRIRHTARTWGADIEALLSGHIKTLLHPDSKTRSFVRKQKDKISLAVSALFFLSTIVICFWSGTHLLSIQKQELVGYLGNAKDLPDKVDIILTTLSSGLWARYYFSVLIFLILSLITSISLGVWVDKAADSNKPSFVLLTRQSDKAKKDLLAKYERKWRTFLLSVFTSIVTGVIGNVLFKCFWE